MFPLFSRGRSIFGWGAALKEKDRCACHSPPRPHTHPNVLRGEMFPLFSRGRSIFGWGAALEEKGLL
jgi:hypothetical protein